MTYLQEGVFRGEGVFLIFSKTCIRLISRNLNSALKFIFDICRDFLDGSGFSQILRCFNITDSGRFNITDFHLTRRQCETKQEVIEEVIEDIKAKFPL